MTLAPDYRYELDRVVRVVDGDTVEVVLGRDVGFRCRPTWRVRLRMEGIDCPERRGTPADQARAHLAAQFTEAWLASGPAIVATSGRTTFERWLATITRGDESLADALVGAGLARRVP